MKIAVLQSLNVDAEHGILVPNAFRERGVTAYEINPDEKNLELVKKLGLLKTVEGDYLRASSLDGVFWRARVFTDFEQTVEMQNILSTKYKAITVENPEAIGVCRGKCSTAKALIESNSVSAPKAIIIDANQDLGAVFEELAINIEDSKFVYAKPDFGSRGYGVKKISSSADLFSYKEEFGKDKFVVQSPIETAVNFTWRVDIVDGHVQHVMKFYGKKDGDISQDDKMELIINPSAKVTDLALKANKVLGGLFLAGIDIMEDIRGNLFVLEANIPALHYLDNQGLGLKDAMLDRIVDATIDAVSRGKDLQRQFVEPFER